MGRTNTERSRLFRQRQISNPDFDPVKHMEEEKRRIAEVRNRKKKEREGDEARNKAYKKKEAERKKEYRTGNVSVP